MTESDMAALHEVRQLVAGINNVAQAISMSGEAGTDATGGRIHSLTEAAMGITAGLVAIAESLSDVARAIRKDATAEALGAVAAAILTHIPDAPVEG